MKNHSFYLCVADMAIDYGFNCANGILPSIYGMTFIMQVIDWVLLFNVAHICTVINYSIYYILDKIWTILRYI